MKSSALFALIFTLTKIRANSIVRHVLHARARIGFFSGVRNPPHHLVPGKEERKAACVDDCRVLPADFPSRTLATGRRNGHCAPWPSVARVSFVIQVNDATVTPRHRRKEPSPMAGRSLDETANETKSNKLGIHSRSSFERFFFGKRKAESDTASSLFAFAAATRSIEHWFHVS